MIKAMEAKVRAISEVDVDFVNVIVGFVCCQVKEKTLCSWAKNLTPLNQSIK